MDLPVYELQIEENLTDTAEVSFVALVDKPAIQKDFLAFKEAVKFEVISEDQRIIAGPLMIPDQLIYRNNEKFGEHYVKFSPETIQQIAIKFAKKGYSQNINLMHDASMQVDGVTMFQSFITSQKCGIMPMKGFESCPEGTWFGSMYVENPDVWKLIKNGDVKGFSVEGLFDYVKPQQMSADAVIQQIQELLKLPVS